ncbi:serine hydrolase domain-containing protein [Aspergillus stella-maris]|uniref:serine hydrolase domain-containing protein n=1 Tax=Aspergillus stella-maris TaxID=1810926 RepID=UPI003CCD6642
MRLHNSLYLTSLCLPGALSNFLGPIYPAPRDLSSRNSLVAKAFNNLTRAFDSSFRSHANTTLSELSDLTFSVGLFSSRDAGAETLQYHHASPETANSTLGTRQPDGDSIYRIASVSKLFTVYAGLIELWPQDWELPLSQIFPELVQPDDDDIDITSETQWDYITPWSLAAQLGGVAQYAIPWTQDLLIISPETIAILGLPAVDQSTLATLYPCTADALAGSTVNCTASEYASGASGLPPIAQPWSSPVYSNNGFTLLGMALANITGRSIDELYQGTIFDPLDMQSSYSVPPPESDWSHGVVISPIENNWASDNGLSKSSGGLYSTLNDLAKFGTSILNHTLLSPLQTRRWMKPLTHTSTLYNSFGAPWEIYRYEHPDTGLITDIYTKLGDSGFYGSIALFIPDFDAGFNVITASSQDTKRSNQTLDLIQAVSDAVIPALTKQAAVELQENYAGTYVSTTKGLNTSITFAPAQDGVPGLEITHWINNGTIFGIRQSAQAAGWSGIYKLRPIISPEGDEGRIVFRPAFTPQDPVRPRDPSNLFRSFYDGDDNAFLGQTIYAQQFVSSFIFDVEADGSASGVELPAWGVNLEKR